MFSSGGIIECNNCVYTLTTTTLRTYFANINVFGKIFYDIYFYNFNPKSHKFMFQKGSTFYVSAVIYAAKTVSIHEIAKTNVAKNV